MSAEVLIGDGEPARLAPHPLRAAILGEVHARPFTAISIPSRVLHFAFDTSGITPGTYAAAAAVHTSDENIPGKATRDITVNFDISVGSGVYGDFNDDGIVDGADLGLLLLDYGPCSGCPTDLNGDGVVDSADLGLLLLSFT